VCAGTPFIVNYTGGTCATSGCTLEKMIFLNPTSASCGNCNIVYSSPFSSTSTQFSVTINTPGTYNVRGCIRAVGKTSVCEPTKTVITVVASPTAPTGGSTAYGCLNEYKYFSTTTTSGTQVHWFPTNSPTGTPLHTGTSYNVAQSSSGTYNYYAFGYNSSTGCYSSTSAQFTHTVYNIAPPSAVLSGPTTGFVGTTYSFTTGSGSGNTYTWGYGGTGTAPIAGGNSSSDFVDIAWSSTGNKVIYLTAVNSVGCTSQDQHNVTITQNCPVASINTIANNCTGTSMSVSAVDEGAGVTYAWNFGTGASPATASGLGPHNITYSSAGSKSVSLTTSKSGCSNDVDTESFTVYQTPNANISGTTSGSTNTSYNFTTPAVSGATYTWTNTGGSGSSTTNSLNSSWSTSGTKNLSVSVSTGGGLCTDSDNHTVVISNCQGATVNPIANTCTGTGISVSAQNEGSGVTYSWNFGSGASIATATGIGPHTVSYSTTGTRAITVTTSKSGCSNVTDAEPFTVYQTPTANISGATTSATNTSQTFTTAAVPGATYTWTDAGGSGSSTSNSLTTSWTTGGSKTVCVTVTTGAGTCTASDCHTVTVTSGPPCTSHFTDYGDNTTINQNMDGTTISVSTGNSVTFNVADPRSVLGDFKITQDYSRGGDSSILLSHATADQATKTSIVFSTSNTDVAFCIRDIDYNVDMVLRDEVYDEVYVIPFSGGSAISLTSSMYTLGTNVILHSSGYFYSKTTEANTSTGGDLCFDFGNTSVDSVQIIYTPTTSRGRAITDEIAISDVKWCNHIAVPVSWLAFNITAQAGANTLNWSTASELNNDFFTIERSSNGVDFDILDYVSGAGTTTDITKYSYVDASPLAGNNYYRVKQTDYDGSFDYTETKHINLNANSDKVVIYPNPAKNEVFVSLVPKATPTIITLKDITGVTLQRLEVSNQSIVPIDLSAYRSGMYFIETSDHTSTITTKVLKNN
jgi:hypothetical protein